MKIRFVDSIRAGHVTFKAGDEVDLPNDQANNYVQSGHARKLPEGMSGATETHDPTKIPLSSANPPMMQTTTAPVEKVVLETPAAGLDVQKPKPTEPADVKDIEQPKPVVVTPGVTADPKPPEPAEGLPTAIPGPTVAPPAPRRVINKPTNPAA